MDSRQGDRRSDTGDRACMCPAVLNAQLCDSIAERKDGVSLSGAVKGCLGNKTAEFVLEAGGECPGVQVPMGQYHTCVCLEDGSVIFEAKDRAYDPEGTEDFLMK